LTFNSQMIAQLRFVVCGVFSWLASQCCILLPF